MTYMRDARGRKLDTLAPPRDIPGVSAWWDFSLQTGAAASNITRATDLTDLGGDLAQYTSGNQPTVGSINGLKSAHFSATGQYLVQQSAAQPWYWDGVQTAVRPQPLTIFAAVAASASTSGSRVVVVQGNGGATIGGSAGMAIDGAGSKNFYGDSGLANSLAGSLPVTTEYGPSVCDGNPHVLVVQIDAPNAVRLLDGWLLFVESGLTVDDGLSAVTVGNLLGGAAGNQFLGDIGEILICSGTLVPAKAINDVTSYLAAKWGVTNVGLSVTPAPVEATTTSPDGTSVHIFTP